MQANVARRDATGVLVEAEGVGLGPSRHLWGKELVTVRGWWTKICWIRISSLFPKHTTVDVWIDIGIYGAETGKEWWVVTDQDPYAFVRSVKKLVYGADVYSIHADSFTIWRKVKLAKRLVSCYAHRQYIYIYRYIIMYIYIYISSNNPTMGKNLSLYPIPSKLQWILQPFWFTISQALPPGCYHPLPVGPRFHGAARDGGARLSRGGNAVVGQRPSAHQHARCTRCRFFPQKSGGFVEGKSF